LKELSKSKNIAIDTLLKYAGMHVLAAVIAGQTIQDKNRKEWMESALNLDKNQSMSRMIEDYCGGDFEKVVKVLGKNYPENFFIMNNSIEYNEKVDLLYEKNLFKNNKIRK
jgi:hypothetical protein